MAGKRNTTSRPDGAAAESAETLHARLAATVEKLTKSADEASAALAAVVRDEDPAPSVIAKEEKDDDAEMAALRREFEARLAEIMNDNATRTESEAPAKEP